MRNRPINIIGIALVTGAVLLAGCERETPRSRAVDTIAFAPGGLQTKGLIGADDLQTNGTSLRVYDYVTGYEGVIDGVSYGASDVFRYFTDEIYYSDNASLQWPWVYRQGSEYTWTKRGTHKFYGWLTVDKKSDILASDLFGSVLSLSDAQAVSIPTVTFTKDSPQFDFSYSNVVTRDVGAAGFDPATPVDLRLSHLFSAVTLTFQNASDIPVTINSVDIPAFPNSGSASIDYSGTEPFLTYADPAPGASPFFSATALAGTTVAVGEQYNVINGIQDDMTYYLTWPAPERIISPSNQIDVVNDIPVYATSDSLISVTYTTGSGGNALTQTAKAKFPSEALQAGKKHHINIQFTNKVINVTGRVLPWDFNDLDLKFDTDAITTPGGNFKLDVLPNTCELSGSVARMSGQNIQCHLTVLTPVGATLVVSMIGDTDYFTVTPDNMTINAGELVFYVCPSSMPTGGVERSIHLSFTVVLPDGREIDANSELIDTNFSFVRQ